MHIQQHIVHIIVLLIYLSYASNHFFSNFNKINFSYHALDSPRLYKSTYFITKG